MSVQNILDANNKIQAAYLPTGGSNNYCDNPMTEDLVCANYNITGANNIICNGLSILNMPWLSSAGALPGPATTPGGGAATSIFDTGAVPGADELWWITGTSGISTSAAIAPGYGNIYVSSGANSFVVQQYPVVALNGTEEIINSWGVVVKAPSAGMTSWEFYVSGGGGLAGGITITGTLYNISYVKIGQI